MSHGGESKDKTWIGLSCIYEILISCIFFICKKLGFSSNIKVKNLTEKQIKKLITNIQQSGLCIATNLKKVKLLINKKLVNTKSYRGLRKLKGLPIRGQRTHTNAKSSRRQKI